jgi:phenazine biosynthesis protein phzE
MSAAGGPLDLVLGEDPPPFALLHRPERTGPGVVEVLTGTVAAYERLADIPLPEPSVPPGAAAGQPRHDVLALVPYRQVAERGWAHVDDGTPLLALSVADQRAVPVAEVLARVPDLPVELGPGTFDRDDAEYAAAVRRIIDEEIGTGEGANFVLRRSFVADISGFTPAHAVVLFRRLLERESGAYWTFVVHTGERTLLGATPERHISVHGGTAVMNPISGTYRYPASGPTVEGVLDFLADRKEAEELYMVVDEELKMMARICEGGGRVVGPYLKEMARLAHTEYFIEGHTRRDPREILRETLFAPTVTGSPLESACRVISRHEPEGRGYYSGVAALIGRDADGEPALDSAILIRTADIDAGGRMSLGVGATLVRHSDPEAEVAETRAKAAGLLAAFGAPSRSALGGHPTVRAALERRNDVLAGFWLASPAPREQAPAGPGGLAGRRVLVVDAEDTFTAMIAHQLRSLGLVVEVRRFDEPHDLDAADLTVLGPGPGDPRDTAHPKIARLRADVRHLLGAGRPFLAVCLSHQVLSLELGLDVRRRDTPNQGVRRAVELFGRRERVGFYNTFAAHAPGAGFDHPLAGRIEVSHEPLSGEVHGLRGDRFASVQFHPESVLTTDGERILARLAGHVLAPAAAPPVPAEPRRAASLALPA